MIYFLFKLFYVFKFCFKYCKYSPYFHKNWYLSTMVDSVHPVIFGPKSTHSMTSTNCSQVCSQIKRPDLHILWEVSKHLFSWIISIQMISYSWNSKSVKGKMISSLLPAYGTFSMKKMLRLFSYCNVKLIPQSHICSHKISWDLFKNIRYCTVRTFDASC